ncbi:MAG TPA: VWA domain-containing protein, partial [Cellvibrionaceae bacterium]|nr:VWA domain-containing protein [Cellvibrionaceae bacterium]
DGVVNIYPVFDQLPASFQINITPPDGGAAITKTLLREQLTPGNKIEITLPTTVAANTNIDVTLVLDTTNSMADEIKYLQAELAQVFNDIAADYAGASIRVGLVAYRDEGDIYVHKEFPFTEDLTRFNADLASLFAGGGGDAPEAMDQGMNGALSLNWRENSTKIMLLVADAPPHNYEIAATWKAALKAREQQIHIVPVGASGLGKRAEFLMRSMAALTHSRYIFLTDDSGVGNSHDEPSVDCYVVTRLDASIRRVLASLIKGKREEPTSAEIIRTQGNYNQGVCEPAKPTSLPTQPAVSE